jgi:hypothetical protein
MKIASDVDGVFLDFDGTWKGVAEEVLHRELPAATSAYHLMPRYQLGKSEYHKVWAAFNAMDMWMQVRPISDAVESLQMLLVMGHELHFVTSIPKHAVQGRQAQIDRLFGAFHKSVVLHPADNGSEDNFPPKETVLRALRPIFYADDCWNHCLEARHALVPYIARIHAGHDGNGDTVDGVHAHLSLSDAIEDFLSEKYRPKMVAG